MWMWMDIVENDYETEHVVTSDFVLFNLIRENYWRVSCVFPVYCIWAQCITLNMRVRHATISIEVHMTDIAKGKQSNHPQTNDTS